MRTEYEEMIKEFLPALRARAAKMLAGKYGKSQVETASLLGTTQAAVSKYLDGNYSGRVKELESRLSEREVSLFVERMLEGDAYEAQKSVCKMCAGKITHDCSLMIK